MHYGTLIMVEQQIYFGDLMVAYLVFWKLDCITRTCASQWNCIAIQVLSYLGVCLFRCNKHVIIHDTMGIFQMKFIIKVYTISSTTKEQIWTKNFQPSYPIWKNINVNDNNNLWFPRIQVIFSTRIPGGIWEKVPRIQAIFLSHCCLGIPGGIRDRI